MLPRILGIALTSAATVGLVHAAPPSWETAPPLSMARTVAAACTAPCGDIYVVGGAGAETSVEILVFDGSAYAEAWIEGPSLNTPRHGIALARVGTFIYAIGGFDSTAENLLTSVERLDITDVSSGWETLPSDQWLNVPRSTPGVAVDDFGRIYVFGGHTDKGFGYGSPSAERFDPANPADGWTMICDMQEARAELGSASDSLGRVYAIGGSGPPNGVHLTTVERMDPCSGSCDWTSVASMPGPASNNDRAVTGADGNIYVAGGWLPNPTGRTIRYLPDRDEWQDLPDLIEARSRPAMALGRDGFIYAIAGDTGGGHLSSVERLDTNPPCRADIDGNGTIDADDFFAYLDLFVLGCP